MPCKNSNITTKSLQLLLISVCQKWEETFVLILEARKTCLFPPKSASMLHWDASQSPLSLIKLDPLKAELDWIVRLRGRCEHWWALWCATAVPERFHTSVKPKEVSELLRGHDGIRTRACFYCSGVRTAGLPPSRALASLFLTNMWMRGEA